MPRSLDFKPCNSCKWPLPISDPHSSCLRCLGEGHISDKCLFCKSFKPRTNKERDSRLKVLVMESALTRALEQRSDSALSTTESVRSTLSVPSTSWHLSHPAALAKKPKKTGRGRSPTFLKGKERAGGEQRPTQGSSMPTSGSQAPAQVDRCSPSHTLPATQDSGTGLRQLQVLSTPEALQATQEILTLPVPLTPALAVPQSRGKPTLGSPRMSPPPQHRSPSHGMSHHHSPT